MHGTTTEVRSRRTGRNRVIFHGNVLALQRQKCIEFNFQPKLKRFKRTNEIAFAKCASLYSAYEDDEQNIFVNLGVGVSSSLKNPGVALWNVIVGMADIRHQVFVCNRYSHVKPVKISEGLVDS